MTEVDSVWKIEKDLCRCCHAEGKFKNLGIQCYNEEEKKYEKYSNMLNENFNIDIMLAEGNLYPITYTICDKCINKLRDACNFRQQVLSCERRFHTFYYNQSIQVPEPVKKEESSDLDEFEYELLTVETIKPESPANQNGNSDIEVIDLDADDDEGIVAEEIGVAIDSDSDDQLLLQPVPAKASGAQRKTSKAKKTKKPKKGKGQEESSAAGEEEAQQNNDGRRPRFLMKPQDYRIEDDAWVCSACNKKFNKRGYLSAHVKAKHYNLRRVYDCKLCSESFDKLSAFNRHKMDVHDIDQRINCNACDKVFSNKLRLEYHIRSFHMLGEKIKCKLCDFEAYSQNKIYRHMVKHKTTKDYKCRFCKKTFLRHTTLAFHERIHTGDRRKICQECGQAFVQKASLNYHMAKHHPGVKF